ncbi:hypothetical protein SARC_08970, partial [Sphaeroforma arctica JP610]
ELFSTDPNYRAKNFTTNAADRPLVVQFCAHDPHTLLSAAKYVENDCDAVDLNLGCPQNIAKRGHYGAFLMEDWNLIKSMVEILDKECKVPVTCKIRMYDDVQKTIDYAKMLEAAGCQLLTLHGRTRDMKGQQSGLADWSIVKAVKQAVSIPVIANGNLIYLEDVHRCLEYTGADGVMSAEGNLYNAAMFSGKEVPVWDLVDEYLQICRDVNQDAPTARHHLFKMYHAALPQHTDIRDKLSKLSGSEGLSELQNLANEFNARLKRIAAKAKPTDAELTKDQTKDINTAIVSVERAYPYWISQPRCRPGTVTPYGVTSRKRTFHKDGPGGVAVDREAVLAARAERKRRKAEGRESRLHKLCTVCRRNMPSQKSGELKQCGVCIKTLKNKAHHSTDTASKIDSDMEAKVNADVQAKTEVATGGDAKEGPGTVTEAVANADNGTAPGTATRVGGEHEDKKLSSVC